MPDRPEHRTIEDAMFDADTIGIDMAKVERILKDMPPTKKDKGITDSQRAQMCFEVLHEIFQKEKGGEYNTPQREAAARLGDDAVTRLQGFFRTLELNQRDDRGGGFWQDRR